MLFMIISILFIVVLSTLLLFYHYDIYYYHNTVDICIYRSEYRYRLSSSDSTIHASIDVPVESRRNISTLFPTVWTSTRTSESLRVIEIFHGRGSII